MLTKQDLKQIANLLDERFTAYDKKMDQRFEQVYQRFEQVYQRFEQVYQRFEQVDQRFEQVDQRFEQIDQRFEQIDQRSVKLENTVDQVDKKVSLVRKDLEEVITQNIMPTLEIIVKDVEKNKKAIKKLHTTLVVHYPNKYDVQDMIGEVRGPIIKLLKMLDGKLDLLIDLLREEKIISEPAYLKLAKIQVVNPIPREKLLTMSAALKKRRG